MHVTHSEMQRHSDRFAKESATSKQKNKMQNQTGIQAEMGADWCGGGGTEEQFCALEKK